MHGLDAALVVRRAAVGRSSRLTTVITTCVELHPLDRGGQLLRLVRHRAAPGLRSVSTLQNRQPRVHSLPATMNVAVPRDQQSLRFRAAGLFADGVQPVFGERVLRRVEDRQRRPARQIHAQPLRQPRARARSGRIDRRERDEGVQASFL